MLACAAHLAAFAGFALIGPLVLYLWKSKDSRFIAFHAVQAMILAVLSAAVAIVAVVIFAIVAVGGVLAVQGSGSAAPGIALFGGWAILAALMLVPTVLTVIAAIRAFQGEWWEMPLVGGLTKRWLAKG